MKIFAKNRQNCQILIHIDNTTAISYINRMSGIDLPHLHKITKEIWQWWEARKIWIFAIYIKSKENHETDIESRKLDLNTEFDIKRCGFSQNKKTLCQTNAKCKSCISWHRDPDSIAIDAFTISWKGLFFMPFLHSKWFWNVYKKSETKMLLALWSSRNGHLNHGTSFFVNFWHLKPVHLRPSLPKYNATWDPKIVLDYFTKADCNEKFQNTSRTSF